MSVGKICVRAVHTAEAGETLRAAGARMRDHAVGCLVVVDRKGLPAGIVTDRDLMLRCVAEDDSPDAVSVAQAMSTPVVSVHESTPIEDALAQMVSAGVRRLPVVDSSGKLVGILALDDVLDLLSEEVTSVGRLLAHRSR